MYRSYGFKLFLLLKWAGRRPQILNLICLMFTNKCLVNLNGKYQSRKTAVWWESQGKIKDVGNQSLHLEIPQMLEIEVVRCLGKLNDRCLQQDRSEHILELSDGTQKPFGTPWNSEETSKLRKTNVFPKLLIFYRILKARLWLDAVV